jgi:hypothetical protein
MAFWRRSAPRQVPQILVWNKIDATAVEAGVERDAYGRIRAFVSVPEPAPGSICCDRRWPKRHGTMPNATSPASIYAA